MYFEKHSVKDTPDYSFVQGMMTMEGKVFPENAIQYWTPIVNDLEAYLLCHHDVVVNFRFDYYSSASMLFLDMIFRLLNTASSKGRIEVNWYYKSDDEDMMIYGEDYKESSKLKHFNLIKIKVEK